MGKFLSLYVKYRCGKVEVHTFPQSQIVYVHSHRVSARNQKFGHRQRVPRCSSGFSFDSILVLTPVTSNPQSCVRCDDLYSINSSSRLALLLCSPSEESLLSG